MNEPKHLAQDALMSRKSNSDMITRGKKPKKKKQAVNYVTQGNTNIRKDKLIDGCKVMKSQTMKIQVFLKLAINNIGFSLIK